MSKIVRHQAIARRNAVFSYIGALGKKIESTFLNICWQISLKMASTNAQNGYFSQVSIF